MAQPQNNKPRRPPLILENVRIVFRNFSGKEGRYNNAGDRNFAVILDDEQARLMLADDWNVKFLKPREEGEAPQPYLPVKVKYREGSRPPKVVLITTKNKTELDEDSVNIIDWAEIKNVDVSINPSWYDVNGKTGWAAYLKSIFVTIVEDELDEKYADVPDSAQNSMGSSFEESPF